MSMFICFCLFGLAHADRSENKGHSLATDFAKGFDEAKAELTEDWETVTQIGDKKRVQRDDFKSVYMGKHGNDEDYMTFLDLVFDAAFDMMLSTDGLESKKHDGDGTLGKHCFMYAGAMANEFYFDGKNGADLLDLKNNNPLNTDWESATKTMVADKERVSLEDFKNVYFHKFNLEGGAKITYNKFLIEVFEVAYDMMKKKQDLDETTKTETDGAPTLGGHCFRYAGAMAREYYFNGVAKDDLNLT